MSEKDAHLRLRETAGDLFSAPHGVALAHCISADCALGAGIARVFSRRYPQLRTALRALAPAVGQAPGYVTPDGRVIFNLVTKNIAWSKPSYATMEAALVALREQVRAQGVRTLAMPRIGCGLDRLEWARVRELIERVFSQEDLEIIVYTGEAPASETR